MVPLQGDGVHAGRGVSSRPLTPQGLGEGEGGVGGRLGGKHAVRRGVAPAEVRERRGVVQLRLSVGEVGLILWELECRPANPVTSTAARPPSSRLSRLSTNLRPSAHLGRLLPRRG